MPSFGISGGRVSRAHSSRRLRRLSVWWVLTLLIGSMLPARAKIALGTVGMAHDAVHVAAFGGAAVLLMLWARTRLQELGLAVMALALGAGIEVAQRMVTDNALEWTDIQLDALGAMVALLCMQFRSIRRMIEIFVGLDDSFPSD